MPSAPETPAPLFGGVIEPRLGPLAQAAHRAGCPHFVVSARAGAGIQGGSEDAPPSSRAHKLADSAMAGSPSPEPAYRTGTSGLDFWLPWNEPRGNKAEPREKSNPSVDGLVDAGLVPGSDARPPLGFGTGACGMGTRAAAAGTSRLGRGVCGAAYRNLVQAGLHYLHDDVLPLTPERCEYLTVRGRGRGPPAVHRRRGYVPRSKVGGRHNARRFYWQRLIRIRAWRRYAYPARTATGAEGAAPGAAVYAACTGLETGHLGHRCSSKRLLCRPPPRCPRPSSEA